MNELVSIIVSIYNGEKYLVECIESVLNQTYEKIELILVNDGSTDHSADIIEKYQRIDSRIKVIHKSNSGVSLSRNKALNIATGQYICLLDQDDLFAPDYVEYYLKLIHDSGADIAVTPRVARFKGEVTLQNNHLTSVEYKTITGKNAAINMLYYKFVIAPWNKMISRDLIEKNNLRFDKRFFGGEGFLFSIECFQRAKKVAVGSEKVYYYRLDNADSGMTKYKESVIVSSLSAQKIIREKIIDKTPDIMKACDYADWHTHYDCLNTFIGCNAISENKELYKEIKHFCKKNAFRQFAAPISQKEKFKVLLYWINPYWGAKIINKLRKRKFTKQ